MKLVALLLGLLLLLACWPPSGHSAHHGRGRCRHLPVRVLRSAGAAEAPKVVRVVQ